MVDVILVSHNSEFESSDFWVTTGSPHFSTIPILMERDGGIFEKIALLGAHLCYQINERVRQFTIDHYLFKIYLVDQVVISSKLPLPFVILIVIKTSCKNHSCKVVI